MSLNQKGNLALIGMSGVGKSYISSRMKEYEMFSVDDELSRQILGETDFDAFGTWLGYPWEDGYADRASRVMHLESDIADAYIRGVLGEGHLFDTSGSIVYSAFDTLMLLKKKFHIIYLKADEEKEQACLQLYMDNPRPIIWRGDKIPTASDRDVLERSYLQLLRSRAELYEQLAHEIIYVKEVESRIFT